MTFGNKFRSGTSRRSRMPSGVFPFLIYTLFFSCFFIPKVLFDQFQTGPVIFICATTGAFFLYLALTAIFSPSPSQKNHALNPNPIDIIVIGWSVYIIIQSLFLRSLFLNEKLVVYICIICIYSIIKHSISFCDKKVLKLSIFQYVVFALIALLLSDCYGLLQYYVVIVSNSPFFFVTGPFFNPGHFANYLACLYPASLIIFLKYDKSWKQHHFIKFASLFIFLLTTIILFILNIRAVWLGIILSSTIILFEHFKIMPKKRSSKITICLILATLLCTVGYFFYKIRPKSADGRLTVWKVTTQIIKDNPAVGVGYGNFEYVYNGYQAKYFSQKRPFQEILYADGIRHAYNEFLHILSEQGLVGIIFFSMFLFYLFRGFLKANGKLDELSSFGLAIAFYTFLTVLIAGMSSYPFDIPTVWFFFFFYAAIISGLYSRYISAMGIAPIFKLKLKKGWYLVLVIFISLGDLYYGLMKYYAYSYCQKAVLAHQNPSANFYNSFLIDNSQYLVYLSNYMFSQKEYRPLINLLESKKNSLNVPQLYILLGLSYSKINEQGLAEKNFLFADRMIPYRFYPKFILLNFYLETNQTNKAKALSDWIIHSKPKVKSAEVENIQNQTKALIEINN